MNEEFKQEVIRALGGRDLTEVRYIGRARFRRCEEHDIRMEKFRGFRDGVHAVAYACPRQSCRRIYVKLLIPPMKFNVVEF